MRRRLVYLVFVLTLLLAHAACGHGQRAAFSPQLGSVTESAASITAAEVTWPASLPADAMQPWETLDGGGRIASSINLDSEFVPGVEWFTAAGSVSELGEASSFASGAPGSEAVSYAIYRIPLGSGQPGTIAADVNLHAGGAYWLGVADYSADTWRWHGPFSAPHVRVSLPHYEYTSALGNLFIAVVAYDGAAFDLVGLGVNARDEADSTAPAIPEAPILTPVAGGLHVRWLQVDAEDLAGYRVYAGGDEALGYVEGGESVVIPASAETEITLTSIDLSGNESAASEPSIETPLEGDIPTIELTASAASGGRNAVIELTASGAETYDWDVDGDGAWDITGDATGTAVAATGNLGIIRPALRGHTADGGFSLSAVSLIIAGNSRPVAVAYAQPTQGNAPLEVSFDGEGVDDDGTVEDYAWDFEGDGIYDYSSPTSPAAMHEYADPGVYNAKLQVTDNEGAWDVDTVSVVVSPPLNSPPQASLSAGPTSGDAPLTVMLDATGTYDPDEPYGDYIARYEWDLEGDGSFDKVTHEPIWWHTYQEPGVYFTTLRVEDSRGGSATMAIRIDVGVAGNEPPVIQVIYSPDEGGPPLEVTFNAGSSYDPDGTVVWYEWDFNGDNAFDASNDSPSATHTYTTGGIFNARLRVTDDDGAQSVFTLPVTVWTTMTVDSQLRMGWYASLAVINGNPMLVHYETSDWDLWTIRATDSSGLTWFYNRSAERTGDVGEGCSLAEVNSRAAIAYTDNTNAYLKYVRSNSDDGYYWGSPVVVVTGFYDGGIDMQMVNGRPAIAFLNSIDGNVYYVRASDVNGASWGTPVQLDTSAAGYQSQLSLAIVNGNPAVAYTDFTVNYLMYVRATDADGSSWDTPVTVDSSGNCGVPDMALVDGRPAIAYLDGATWGVFYTGATDANGSSWGSPVTISWPVTSGPGLSLAVVDGRPAVSFHDYANKDLCFVHAADSTGEGWNAPVVVDHVGTVGIFNSLAEVNGMPGIGYMDATASSLKYAIRYIEDE